MQKRFEQRKSAYMSKIIESDTTDIQKVKCINKLISHKTEKILVLCGTGEVQNLIKANKYFIDIQVLNELEKDIVNNEIDRCELDIELMQSNWDRLKIDNNNNKFNN